MLIDPGDHFGMSGLHEQRPNATDERGRVADDLPRHRRWAEQPRITEVVEGVLERLGPVGEEAGRGGDDTIT